MSGAPPPAGVEVRPAAPEEEPVLANLLELYAHDFSALADLQLHPDGRYGYPGLPRYWQEDTRVKSDDPTPPRLRRLRRSGRASSGRPRAA